MSTAHSCTAPVSAVTAGTLSVDACAELEQILVEFESGYTASEAIARSTTVGWPAGMPSGQVRGVANLYRRWVAVEENERAGLATYDDSVDAAVAALHVQKNVCGR
jgi:hypothetical protein